MTDTKLLEKTNETSTVEPPKINYELGRATVQSDKHKIDFEVYKARDNTPFYSVRTTGFGNVPKELSGKYTTIPRAIEAIERYLKTAKETFAVKSDILAERRNAAKARSENS